MSPLLVCYAALVGACTGSFLNVVAARVPAGRSVVRPRSACPVCGHQIAFYDNLPVWSWCWLRARCRHCGAAIPARYVTVELFGAVLFVALVTRVHPGVCVPAAVVVMSIALASALIDAEHLRLPNPLTLAAAAAALTLGALGSLLDGNWHRFALAALAATVAFVALAVIHLAVPRGFGAGDVKYVFPLAFVVALESPALVAVMLFVAVCAAGVLGAGMLLSSARFRHQARRVIPFGPFLYLGALVALVAGDTLWQWYCTQAGL